MLQQMLQWTSRLVDKYQEWPSMGSQPFARLRSYPGGERVDEELSLPGRNLSIHLAQLIREVSESLTGT